jgi:L-asparaginase
MSDPAKLVVIIGTGGTIAESTSATSGRKHLTATELAGGSAPRGVGLMHRDLFDVPSTCIGPHEMLEMVVACRDAFAAGAQGVVVTHGTDTLEETASFLECTLSGDVPVVLTGAMRPPDLAGADGAMNLEDAIRIAADHDAFGMGALVVMAGEIHSAQDVRKQHSSSLTAFGSGERGLIGRIEEGRIRWLRRPIRSPALPIETIAARVEGLKTYAGMEDFPVRAAIDAGIDALVIEAMGSGQVPPSLMPVLRDAAAAGVKLIIASRCGDGPLIRNHYGLPQRVAGDERDLLEIGGIFSELPGTKARIKTIVGLSAGLSRAELADWLI